MSEVKTRQFKTTMVSQLPKAEAPAERSSAASQLYNNTNSHVSVLRTVGDVPQEVFTMAVGATSDSFEAGSELYIRFSEDGASTLLTWSDSDNFTVCYIFQKTASEGMNTVS